MGYLSTPEYETRESETLADETDQGRVKHNGKTGCFAIDLPFSAPRMTEPAATMSNDRPNQPESAAIAPQAEGTEIDHSFGFPVEDTPLWADLYESIRDLFFPPKLPPLELTSTPVAVVDPMAVKRNPWAVATSAVLNGGILALLLFAVVKPMIQQKKPDQVLLTPIDLTDAKLPKAAVSAGGGGGSPDKIEAIKGKTPPRMQTPAVAPKIQSPTPSIDVQQDIVLLDNPTLPNFGMSNSTNVKLGSMGNGTGTGLGSGNGSGVGPGSGGNYGGGLYRIGGAVSEPKVIYSVDPEFSDEARRAKYQGIVELYVIVDAQGNPQNPRVVRALGMGLDEKAIEAVMKFKFKPALKDGKTPVPVMVPIEINFRLY